MPERFSGDVSRRAGMDVVDFTPGVRHAGRFSNVAGFVQGIIVTVRICLQDAAVSEYSDPNRSLIPI